VRGSRRWRGGRGSATVGGAAQEGVDGREQDLLLPVGRALDVLDAADNAALGERAGGIRRLETEDLRGDTEDAGEIGDEGTGVLDLGHRLARANRGDPRADETLGSGGRGSSAWQRRPRRPLYRAGW